MRHALVIACVLGVAGVARAQPENAAIAEELFNDAKRLLDQGKIDQACPKFAESLRLDPTLGTRLNLARCYEMAGRNVKAWAQYKEVVRAGASDPKRAAIARERVAALDALLARATLVGTAELVSVSGLKIKLDGEVLDAAIIGTAFPIDPGDHTLDLVAPGKKTRSMSFHVDAGKSMNVELPALENEVAAAIDESPKTAKPDASEPAHHDDVPQGKRIGGWVTVGVGAAVLGVGAAFGILTLSLASEVSTLCPTGPCPTQDGIDKNASAHTDALLADILLPVGLAAIGVGIYLVVTAPRHAPAVGRLRITPMVSASSGGLAIGGSF